MRIPFAPLRRFLYPLPIRQGRIWNEHVEINAAEHCNLSCRSCSHQSPIMPRRYVDPERVYSDLSTLATVYHAGQVSLLGGEPLLHPDLPAVAEAARRSGVADGVRVVTNGVLLPRMTPSFWAAVDEVRVSMYPGHELEAGEIEHCRRMAAEHRVTLKIKAMDEFFESYAALGTKDSTLVKRVYESCTVAHLWRCHLVTEGWFFKCPHAHFLAKSLRLATDGPPPDAIEIAADSGFRRRLIRYLKSSVPLRACTFCLGTAGRSFRHEQVPRGEWSAPQQRTMEELVDRDLLASAPRYL